VFLLGAWSAMFSSLLGVWQSTPYLFSDCCRLLARRRRSLADRTDLARSTPYQIYLFAAAIVPAVGLWKSFVEVQKIYAVFGALFIPMLALVLLVLNGRAAFIGYEHRNSGWTSLLLLIALLVATVAGVLLA